jgi:hypothetical protein
MLSRARIFAAVTLLVSCLVGSAAWAQVQNLEAGKSPSQLFAGTCNACHKSPRGLLRTVSPGALPGFLREHYTTSGDMASQLSSFLISNGAGDNRQTKQGTDKQGTDKQGAGNDQTDRQGRRMRNVPPQEAARPDDGVSAGEGGRQGRKRMARPGEPPEEGRPGALAPAQAGSERAPDGRRLRQRLGKPAPEEPPVAKDEPPKAEPPKPDTAKPDTAKAEPDADKAKGEDAKVEGVKGVGAKEETGNVERPKPDAEGKSNEAKSNEGKSEAAKIEAPKDNASGEKPPVRRDPAPAVTSAPPAASSTPAPAVASGASTEQPAAPPTPAPASQPPAVTASVPPPSPPAGPPAPPISQ